MRYSPMCCIFPHYSMFHDVGQQIFFEDIFAENVGRGPVPRLARSNVRATQKKRLLFSLGPQDLNVYSPRAAKNPENGTTRFSIDMQVLKDLSQQARFATAHHLLPVPRDAFSFRAPVVRDRLIPNGSVPRHASMASEDERFAGDRPPRYGRVEIKPMENRNGTIFFTKKI